ncbi:ethanolamine ammonia-lyase reactivating factor EutA [Candidatus Dojkabacteria bacterium]|uniref:Ethanolamine ammonia-lyase reactivating factor EutA n=1 Tax=Candidatus Dojkabacteria bacterium TaxID=2099670 RepID=A0A955L6W2_9BACT|nr:ethanolamine ammonia-lyase reactivating factor EutA [Candidatus Dojkabacteria bacterium]
MAFSLFSKKQKQEKDSLFTEESVFLTLDVGTEFIKSAIYRVNDNGAEIIGYSRVKQHSKAMEGAMVVNIEHVCSAADRGIGEALAVADKILGEECPFPEFVTMGISGELVKGVSIVANYERENPDERITHDELQDVVESVREQAFPDSIEDIAEEMGTSPNKIKEIMSHIDSTYIDGVKVDDPIGFTGEEVSYRVFSTFAPSLHINSLYEIADRLELEILTIDVQPYAIAKMFKGSHKSDFSSIFIDVGGGTSDVALIQDGGILGTKMVAFGGRVFSRRIATALNLELHDAEELKINYALRKVQETTQKKVKVAIAKDAHLWSEAMEIALEEFKEVESFPTEIHLSGGGSELPELKEALMAYPWLTVLPFERFPKINHIYPNQIEHIEDRTGMMIGTGDVAPAALTSISFEHIKNLL